MARITGIIYIANFMTASNQTTIFLLFLLFCAKRQKFSMRLYTNLYSEHNNNIMYVLYVM